MSCLLALVAALSIAGTGQSIAADVKCGAEDVPVPDERKEGDKLCMTKAEWDKAKTICEGLGTQDPLECVCQDGDKVGACGD